MAKQRKSSTANFNSQESYKPRNKKEEFLLDVLIEARDSGEMAALMRDLMTNAEIEEFSNRLEMARLLLKGYSYQRVADEAHVSTTTVSRVAHWLYNGCGGYYKVIRRLIK